MWLPARLRSALQSLELAQNLQVEVQELRALVEGLEASQLARELEWRETKDQVMRHLKRVQAIKQHAEGRDQDNPARPRLADVLALKFRGASPTGE